MTLDLIVLGFLGVVIITRMRRGFAYSVEELVGIAVTLGIALLGYGAAAGAIGEFAGRPPKTFHLLAFGFLLVAGQIGYRIFAVVQDAAYARFRDRRGGHRILALFPALGTGLLVAAVLLTSASSVVVSQEFQSEVKGSVVSRSLIEGLAPLRPRVAELSDSAVVNLKLLGGDAEEILVGRHAHARQLHWEEEAEDQMLAFINRERVDRGLAPLAKRLELQNVARAHSRDMAAAGFFDHVSPTHGGLVERLTEHRVSYDAAGENLAIAGDAHTAHEALMDSPSHRENLLRAEYRQVGIGVVDGGASGLVITEEFSD